MNEQEYFDLIKRMADDVQVMRRITMGVFYGTLAVVLIVGLVLAVTY